MWITFRAAQARSSGGAYDGDDVVVKQRGGIKCREGSISAASDAQQGRRRLMNTRIRPAQPRVARGHFTLDVDKCTLDRGNITAADRSGRRAPLDLPKTEGWRLCRRRMGHVFALEPRRRFGIWSARGRAGWVNMGTAGGHSEVGWACRGGARVENDVCKLASTRYVTWG